MAACGAATRPKGREERFRRPSQATIDLRLIDATNFRTVPFGADGKPLPELNLHPLIQAYLNLAVDAARQETDALLAKMRLGQGF